ncbi:MAG: hypothetical protein ABSH52_14100 [Terriglobia bacterium]
MRLLVLRGITIWLPAVIGKMVSQYNAWPACTVLELIVFMSRSGMVVSAGTTSAAPVGAVGAVSRRAGVAGAFVCGEFACGSWQ